MVATLVWVTTEDSGVDLYSVTVTGLILVQLMLRSQRVDQVLIKDLLTVGYVVVVGILLTDKVDRVLSHHIANVVVDKVEQAVVESSKLHTHKEVGTNGNLCKL